jgi:hypothetical protein
LEEGASDQFQRTSKYLVIKRCKGDRMIQKSKPYISIICPVMRLGGLDIMFSSLANQTFKDFELILIDNIYEYRKQIVEEKAKQCTFQYKHFPPSVNKFPIHNMGAMYNHAILQCQGEIILFTSDYRYFMPWSIQKHADFHRAHGDNAGYAPGTKFVLPQQLKCGVPSYGTNYIQYMNDLKDNKLEKYMWSIYENEFTNHGPDPSAWKEIGKEMGHDPKVHIAPETEISPLLFFLQTESIKTKVVLQANGINEEMDGAPNYQDIEFSHRLRNLFDFKFYGDNTNTTYRVEGGHGVIQKTQLIQSASNNAQSIFKKYEAGSKDMVNGYSLQEAYMKNKMDNAKIN